jgi:hypothetical protein
MLLWRCHNPPCQWKSFLRHREKTAGHGCHFYAMVSGPGFDEEDAGFGGVVREGGDVLGKAASEGGA